MSMAVKYAMKKKMAKGGDVEKKTSDGSMTPGGTHLPLSKVGGGEKRGRGMSAAGEHVRSAKHLRENGSPGVMEPEARERVAGIREGRAKNLHREALGKLESMRGQNRQNLAEGGEACMACQGGTCMEHGGMVDRIMAKRRGSSEPTADFESNDFDVLDDMSIPGSADYTGANSGDEAGNEALDENDHDLVSRIMRSRAKRDRMPRPA